MILKIAIIRKLLTVFLITTGVMTVLHLLIGCIHFDLGSLLYQHIDSKTYFIEFAPEIWLTLLSIVLGTLIIVISIASQRNPKLIDYYLGDYPSLYYTCAITLSGMENIYLQLSLSVPSHFWSNVVFVNAYFLLPLAIINAIPYTFYILSYTKTSSLIRTIYVKNRRSIKSLFGKKKIKNLAKTQFEILETINQLDDQLEFVQFKEPKSQVVNLLSELLQFYLKNKHKIAPSFYEVTKVVESDISFRTLSDKYRQMEEDQTFLEHKVFRIYSGIYYHLIESGHHDLASQCANELAKVGVQAVRVENHIVLDLTLMQFNTFLRSGIKYANQTKDIRNAYNCVFHYTQLVIYFIENRKEELIIQACEYLTYYGKEIYKLSFSESYFTFLIDAFASEIQRILIETHKAGFDKDFQLNILKTYATIEPEIEKDTQLNKIKNSRSRCLKIALILFYMDKGESVFVNQLVDDIIYSLRHFDRSEVFRVIKRDCSFLTSTKPTFWEYTDRGDKNIYFTPYKEHIKKFYKHFTNHYIRIAVLGEKYDLPQMVTHDH